MSASTARNVGGAIIAVPVVAVVGWGLAMSSRTWMTWAHNHPGSLGAVVCGVIVAVIVVGATSGPDKDTKWVGALVTGLVVAVALFAVPQTNAKMRGADPPLPKPAKVTKVVK